MFLEITRLPHGGADPSMGEVTMLGMMHIKMIQPWERNTVITMMNSDVFVALEDYDTIKAMLGCTRINLFASKRL